MTRPLVLLGAGPVLTIARAIAADVSPGATAVVVDLPPDRIADADVRALVGTAPGPVDAFAAIGLHALNHARSDLCARLSAAGYALARLVHPRAIVDRSARLGVGVLIGAGASVGPGAEIGDGCVILDGARIEAGARVGAYAWIGANVAVGFGASVGAHTILRPGVNLDAGVPVGDHCELATPGLRQKAIPDRTFETPNFDRPVRVYAPATTRTREPADG